MQEGIAGLSEGCVCGTRCVGGGGSQHSVFAAHEPSFAAAATTIYFGEVRGFMFLCACRHHIYFVRLACTPQVDYAHEMQEGAALALFAKEQEQAKEEPQAISHHGHDEL